MSDESVDDAKMPLLDHLIELRSRMFRSLIALVVAFFACFYVSQTLFDFLAGPLYDALGTGQRLIYTDLTEPFFTRIKVAFFFAAVVCFPIFASQFWLFVAPGLYKNERNAFLPFLFASPVLFGIGFCFVYYFIFPVAWTFFIDFGTQQGGDGTLPIQLEAKMGEYLSLVMKLIFAFGICFQLPVFLTLLARAGLATSKGMAEKRKYAIVGVFIVAAIFTPPDPLSQIGLAIPIILLYELSIVLAKLAERQRAKREAEVEADLDDEDED